METQIQFTEKLLNIWDKHTDSLAPKYRFSIIKSIEGVYAFETHSNPKHMSDIYIEALLLLKNIIGWWM